MKVNGVELLPCPFCGGEGMVINSRGIALVNSSRMYWIECLGCSAAGPTYLRKDSSGAVEKWNERAEVKR